MASPIRSSSRIGFMCSSELLTNEVDRLLSYSWNYQFPPPDSVMSCDHRLRFRVVKSSKKISF